jgi:large subunit ribosomal protein L33
MDAGPSAAKSALAESGRRPQNGLFGEKPMAKKSKDARSYVKLESSESDHCYYVQKNRNNTKERLQLKRYDPVVRKHVMYKEGKM